MLQLDEDTLPTQRQGWADWLPDDLDIRDLVETSILQDLDEGYITTVTLEDVSRYTEYWIDYQLNRLREI